MPFDGSVWPAAIRAIDESIAPNLYDFGDDITAWAHAVLDLAGPGPLDLVGNSIGGSCALEIAALAPDRVRSIVFMGATAGHRPEPDFRDEALRLLREEGISPAWERYWLPLFGPSTSSSVLASALELVTSIGAEAVARGVHAFHTRPDRHQFALDLDVPFLVLTGEFDLNPPRSRTFAADLRQGEFATIEGAGHYGTLEHPDAVAAALEAFAQRVAHR